MVWALMGLKEGSELNFSILCLAIPRFAKKFFGKVKIVFDRPKCVLSETLMHKREKIELKLSTKKPTNIIFKHYGEK